MQISEELNSALNVYALKIAGHMQSVKIETEHLLYGILCIETSNGAKVLKNIGITKSALERAIMQYSKRGEFKEISQISYSKSVSQIISKASELCSSHGKVAVGVDEVLYTLVLTKNSRACKFLTEVFKVDLKQIEAKLAKTLGVSLEDEKMKPERLSSSSTELPEELLSFGENLSKKVRQKLGQKIIGRDSETARVIEILCRKQKNNPVLVGEAGVGKTSVVEGLAQRIELGEVPEILMNKVIFSLDIASLVSGTKFRGSLEERLKTMIQKLISNPNIIVFIDEIHTLSEVGSGDGEISPVDIFKPYLARGEIKVIGATTLAEYREYIERDPALERRFQPVKVEEPSEEDAIKILMGIRESYENFHKVKILDSAIESAVKLSERYITNRFLPDKAIDLIDEACSRVKVNSSSMPEEVKVLSLKIKELQIQKEQNWKNENYLQAEKCKQQIAELEKEIENFRKTQIREKGSSFGEVGEEEIRTVVSVWTNIPVNRLSATEREKLLKLESLLGEKVIGQDAAVSEVARCIRRSRAGISDPNRPIGSFFFLGSTGVGKTELAKAMGEIIFDGENSIIRFDMSEFRQAHSVSRLIGAPPGYVGHEDGGELTKAVEKNPYSLVLFDEIEKAHPDIFNILLQILDDGRLTDSQGKLVNFKNTIIILTSNNGVQELNKRRKFEERNPSEPKVVAKDFLLEKLKENFKPELINRIDSIVVFESLKMKDVLKIAEIMLNKMVLRLKKKQISLEITNSAKMLICKKGYSEEFGARSLRRVIDKEISDPIAEIIISKNLQSNSAIQVDARDDRFVFNVLC